MQRLGQHFLKNKSAIKKIVAALDLDSDPIKSHGDNGASIVIEIGPGHGELTEELVRQTTGDQRPRIKIIAIEKDKALANALARNFQFSIINYQSELPQQLLSENFLVINGDALKILAPLVEFLNLKIENLELKIVGNIPYYITGKLFRILSETKNKPIVSVFTIQKEVAERICARPPRLNRLAAITQFWAEPKILFKLSPDDFSPPPEVDSAVIKLEAHNMYHEAQGIQNYYKTVKILFAQPRKTILNNLVAGAKNDKLKIMNQGSKEEISKKLLGIGIKPSDRPQNLEVKDIIKISEVFIS